MNNEHHVAKRWDCRRLPVLLIALAVHFHCGAFSATAADESPAVVTARLQKKAEAVVAGVQKELDQGTLRQDVIDKVQKLDGLMENRKYQEAEALLDAALRTLGVDPKTVPAAGPAALAKKNQTPSSGAESLTEFDPAGFTKIFDGKTLNDWDGDPKYWTVEDGKLVGTVTPETLLEKNSWIVWRGGLVEDFEFVLDYRVSAQGNSGVGYRLAVLADDLFSVRGPQADIHGANMFTGICYEENGRRLLAARGQSTWIDDPGGEPRLIAQIADPEELQGLIRKEEWNRYRLVVKGNDAKHFINGVLMSEVHDHDETNRMHQGLLGVQVHVGPPMKIEYRDIYLKHLSPQPEGKADRGSVIYRPGSLLEREHPPTFENLVKQTARLTASASDQPLDGKTDLDVVTRELGIVRHDLVDVKLYGESKPAANVQSEYDLVVISGTQTIRVPNAGHLLIGKPLDREYRVRMKWNDGKKQYDVLDLSPVHPDRPATDPGADTTDPGPDNGSANRLKEAWLDEVQTYCMLPLFPEDAKALHASVNGVWAGIGGTHPILPHTEHVPAVRRKYGDDARAFVKENHDAGLLVCAAVNGLEGMVPLRQVVPNLDAMACRKADGEPAVTRDGMTLMCTNNPEWVRWEFNRGRQAIDEGADLILLDTPMSSSFISGFLGAGFCDHCMSTFEKHLVSKYQAPEMRDTLGLTKFEKASIIERLRHLQKVTPIEESPHVKDTADARLFREFIVAQEEASFETRKSLLTELRSHADKQGAEVAFATNAADLGTENPGGHWIRGIMFADLVDFFAYEQNSDPNGGIGAPLTPLPRGKWAAFHKLAHAIHGRRSPAVIHAGNMGQLLMQVISKQKSMNTWMAAQVAEAYAANGAYIIYQIGVPGAEQLLREKCWAKAAAQNEFILSHRDLYAGDLRSGSPLAFLFLFNDRGRTIPAVFPSYLGLAQGFIETNHPFDVVFAGDGHFVADQLDATKLEAYDTIIVPSPIRPTENQKRVVQAFANSGGVVVCQEPELLGLAGEVTRQSSGADSWWVSEFAVGNGRVIIPSGEVSITETSDVGSKFYRQYSDELRDEIATMAKDLGLRPLLQEHGNGVLSAFPVVQPEQHRLVIHLVNYDIDHARDAIRAKQNVSLSIPAPRFLSESARAILYQAEDQAMNLDATIAEGMIRVTIPIIQQAAVLVVSSEK